MNRFPLRCQQFFKDTKLLYIQKSNTFLFKKRNKGKTTGVYLHIHLTFYTLHTPYMRGSGFSYVMAIICLTILSLYPPKR